MATSTAESPLVTTSTEQERAIRPVLPALSLLFLVGSILVLLGGTQLFVFPERTEDFFAWTIKAPITATVDGAFFYTGFILLFPASRAKSWAEVRPVAFAVLIVACTKLLATLLDLDLFHFDDDFQPAFAAWAWLAVYIVIPVGLAILITMQLRMDGGDPPAGPRLPGDPQGRVRADLGDDARHRRRPARGRRHGDRHLALAAHPADLARAVGLVPRRRAPSPR